MFPILCQKLRGDFVMWVVKPHSLGVNNIPQIVSLQVKTITESVPATAIIRNNIRRSTSKCPPNVIQLGVFSFVI